MLYATAGTVASLSGARGYQTLAFRLADTRSAAVSATIADVRRALAGMPGFRGLAALPQVRPTGDWPGRSGFQKFTKFFDIVTVLALLSALVLIANTITTLVAEQTAEIGVMKALGGRRRQIAAIYLTTALLLGALGTLAGVVLGTVLANVLTASSAGASTATSGQVGVDARSRSSRRRRPARPLLAALPAIRRAVRVPVGDALGATGSAVGGQDAATGRCAGSDCCPGPSRSGFETPAGADAGASPRRS